MLWIKGVYDIELKIVIIVLSLSFFGGVSYEYGGVFKGFLMLEYVGLVVLCVDRDYEVYRVVVGYGVYCEKFDVWGYRLYIGFVEVRVGYGFDLDVV